jgi:hypothetical protein
MEVGGFPFLSQLSQHMGCSPLFSFLCLFNFFCQLVSQVDLFPLWWFKSV